MKRRVLIALLIFSVLMMGACDPDKQGTEYSGETEKMTMVSDNGATSTNKLTTVVTTEQAPGTTQRETTTGNIRLPKDEF